LTKAKEGIARPLAYLGIVFGVLGIIILTINIWHLGFGYKGDILAFTFSFLAMILGGIALKLASEKERTLCYISIILGLIGSFPSTSFVI
jgi:hypothetical protein